MFFISITKSEIANNLQSFSVEQLKINSSIVTVVTDDFLSSYSLEQTGFSVIESPFKTNQEFDKLILSQVTYNNKKNLLEIFRSLSSGRPIYYHINSKGELYCSTHISMLRKAGVKIEENRIVLPEFFVYRFVMPPQTLYKNIKQLFAGSQVYIKFLDGKCKIKAMENFVLPKKDKNLNSLKNITKQTSFFLSKSIKALNAGKDRVSVLLSGGLDSSILFKISKDLYGVNTTYSTGYPFEDPSKEIDKEYALSAAHAFQVKHNYYEPTNEQYLHGIIEAISIAEIPVHHLQSVAYYLLLKGGIPSNKDIVICGEGADTVWGDNKMNIIYNSNKMLFKLLLKHPINKIFKIASCLTGRGKIFIDTALKWNKTKNLPLQDPNHFLWDHKSEGSENWVCDYFNVTRYDIIKNRHESLKLLGEHSVYDLFSFYDFLSQVTITQSIWAKLGESQRKILYYPFEQLDLLNYCYSIPWDLKLRNPKDVLRNVARHNNVPEFIITRPKSGFGIRKEGWAEKGEIFDSLIPVASKVFDEKQIRDMQSADPKKAMTFWNILNYSIWKRICINNEPIEVLLEELN